MHPTVTIAQRAALNAGKVILRYWERLDRLTVNVKQRNDFVTEADVQAEQEIIYVLRKAFPSHSILAEERGNTQGTDDEYQWLIDPLDGTTNFIHGFPHFAVSIALRFKGRLEIGVVYDPLRQEMFTAARGNGARLNDRRIRVKAVPNLESALLGTGFPLRQPEHIPAYLNMFGSLFTRCGELRRAGAAALDLSYVAAGRLDGFWEIGLNAWDIGAGALLVQEAGGLVSDFSGGHNFLKNGNIVAGNAKLFKVLLQTIKPHLTPALAN
ncbi:MAG: inositol-1-monophosphatase [Candidatus Competibacteraceae bacterium]|jgi:myo-inositol-1(or 4)-monophosphatase|nr:inositol-1-monophosphatase [Candidatus Competibacteraceae bacterium]